MENRKLGPENGRQESKQFGMIVYASVSSFAFSFPSSAGVASESAGLASSVLVAASGASLVSVDSLAESLGSSAEGLDSSVAGAATGAAASVLVDSSAFVFCAASKAPLNSFAS